MPHEVDGQVHWHEPAGLSAAGLRRFLRPASTHDRFMADEAIPVLRAAAFADLRTLPVSLWRRLGAAGAYLQPFGTEGGLGFALLELPPSGASRPEKHLFEEMVLVLEGRGTTELWRDHGPRVTFEWQPGSLFAIPTNALHRMVNATDAPVRLLSVTSAPALLNLLGDVDAVFANPFAFTGELDEDAGQAFDDIEPDPVHGLALCRTGLVPDTRHCDLPLDNRYSPGYRQMQLAMTGPSLICSIGEHRPGRYAKAFVPAANTAILCLGGKGFSYVWPTRLGPTPWLHGHAAEVKRIAHAPFTMLGLGPCYHQIFNTGSTPLRHLAWTMPERASGPPGEEMRDTTSTEPPDGGTMIAYQVEDPFLRTEYAQVLAALGVTNRMRDSDYLPDAD